MTLTPKFLKNTLWLVSIISTVIGVIGMQTYGSIELSPFISTPQDTIPALGNWASKCFTFHQVKDYFIYDAVFASGLFGLHVMIYSSLRQTKNTLIYFVIWVFSYALLLDLLEGILYWNLRSSNQDSFTSIIPYQNGKIIFYVLSWSILVYTGIRWILYYVRNNRSVLKILRDKYWAYFYPNVINLVLLFILFNTMSQFDAVMIELTKGEHLFSFSILFLVSIITMWFIPYYIQFTESFYDKLIEEEYSETKHGKATKNIYVGSENYKKLIKWYNGLFSVKKILHKEAKSQLQKKMSKEELNNLDKSEQNKLEKVIVRSMLAVVRPISDEHLSGQALDEFKANKIFHVIRRTLGVLFILVLFYLQYDALFNMMHWEKINAPLATTILGIIYFSVLTFIENKVRSEKARLWTFLAFLAFLSVFFFCLYQTQANYEYQLSSAVKWFTSTTMVSGFAFICYAVYRYPKEKVKLLERDKADSELPRETDNHQASAPQKASKKYLWLDVPQNIINSIFIFLTLLVPVLALSLFIWCLCCDFSMLAHQHNPANIYLLYVNGIICMGALIGRFRKLFFKTKIREIFSKKKLREDPVFDYFSVFTAAVLTFLILLIYMRNQEDFHHEVNYLNTENAKPTLTLKSYTDSFLDRTATGDSTIYIVAAEGGGLRAAYWTMLVLDELGQDVFDRTFLFSGASGGAIGQGIYNYLQSHPQYKGNENKNARCEIIDQIGNSNFLSTDLTGLLTRSTISSVLPIKKTKYWPDRHQMMAKSYFNIIGNNEWDKAAETPFYQMWEKSPKLPLIFVNTTRTEDGSRAVVRPFKSQDVESAPYLNISKNYEKNYISYPEAIFLTNRFPVASPAARVESRGHFVDGGYYENTGLKTVMHTLLKMQARAKLNDTTFMQFFKRDIVLISIRNSKDAFMKEQLVRLLNYNKTDVNRIFKKGELSSVISAAAGSGMTGLSNYYEAFFYEKSVQNLFNLSDYHAISLPYLLDYSDPHKFIFNGQIVSKCDVKKSGSLLNYHIDSINYCIKNHVGMSEENFDILMPPLGRMMNKTTTEYMKSMLNYRDITTPIEE